MGTEEIIEDKNLEKETIWVEYKIKYTRDIESDLSKCGNASGLFKEWIH